MAWPSTTEYNDAIQNLRTSVSDEELRAGELARTSQGLPMLWSGNFADVYRVHCAQTGSTWAVKCFTRESPGLKERYREISAHLNQARLPFMVDFQFVEPGILVGGQRHPFLKMRWVEGLALNEFVEQYLGRRATLRQLLGLWVKLAARLREARIAHADLQHGNVLLVPLPQGQLALRLIDYDGMYVPALAGTPSAELGHPAYQHPQRLRQGIYSLDVDRFSHLAIFCAVRCLMVGRRDLWRFHTGENLLFREPDFARPERSEVFRELWALPDVEARSLVGRLFLAAQRPLAETPLLGDVLSNGSVVPLSGEEQRQVDSALGGGVVVAQPSGVSSAGQVVSVEKEPWWETEASPLPEASAGGTVGTLPDVTSGTQPTLVTTARQYGAKALALGAKLVRGTLHAPVAVLRGADGVLRAVAGEENVILHNFLRMLALVALVLLAFVGVRMGPEWIENAMALITPEKRADDGEFADRPDLGRKKPPEEEPEAAGEDSEWPDLPDLEHLRDFDPEAAFKRESDPSEASEKETPERAAVGEGEKPARAVPIVGFPTVELPREKPADETGPPERPPTADPLQGLADSIDLPEVSLGREGPAEPITIGKIDSGPDVPWQLYLLGGENALGKNRTFALQLQEPDPAKAKWEVQLETSSGTSDRAGEDVATLGREDDALKFQWARKATSSANYLRNCILQVRVAGKSKYLTLTEPKTVHPIPIDLEGGMGDATVPVKWMPDAANLRVEITKVEGREGHVTEPAGPADASTPVVLSFPRTDRHGNTADRVAFRLNFTPRPAGMLVRLQLVEPPRDAFRAFQRSAESQRNLLEAVRDKINEHLYPTRGEPPRGVERSQLDARLDGIERQMWYLDFYLEVQEKAQIHYRVYTEVDGREVVLASTQPAEQAAPPREAAEVDQKQVAVTSASDITVDLGGGVTMEMVRIPAGEFLMGSDASDDEKPQHRVRITQPFYLGKYEVTQEQWAAVMGDNPSQFKGPKNPVEQVSWDDCQEFLERLNGKSRSAGATFRLPTEAEWEYACRAGSTTRWCFGDEEGSLGQFAWYDGNSASSTHPVGQKRPNAWGLYDLHGNVWEWCADWYDSGYYSSSPSSDPRGQNSGRYRVLRGGSWNYLARNSRSASRYCLTPDYRGLYYGFRVARTP